MKSALVSLLILLAIGLNLLTARFDSAHDGWDVFGFPFVFYRFSAAKGDLLPQDRYYFSFPLLAVNLFIYLALIYLLNKLYIKLVKKKDGG